MNKCLLLFYVSLLIPSLSIKQDLSFGYDDNFMRFSPLEIDSYHPENYTDNDYLGDAKTYDSAIISPSIQFTISNKIFDAYKTNLIFRTKYTEYTSSNNKSYISFLGRFEFKLASYSWIKLSYSLIPEYYLRTYIDRDVFPLEYYPCDFLNETVSISYSHNVPINKTWMDYKLILNNQFYNENFTEYDSQILGFEGTIKSKLFLNYYISLTYLYYNSNNISYHDSQIIESTKIDRSYIRNGFKINAKKYFSNFLISSMSFKLNFSQRLYDLDSWYYESDNWKIYNDYDLRLEISKKISNKITAQITGRHFFRDVFSSQSDEVVWVEDYKNHHRNEVWLRFTYTIPVY